MDPPGRFLPAARAVEGRGHRQKTDICLTNRPGLATVFQNSAARPARRFMGPDGALTIRAKRNGDQVIENKQFREMARFAPMNDFNDLRSGCETLRFAWRNESCRLAK